MTAIPPTLSRVRSTILKLIDLGVRPDVAHDLFVGAGPDYVTAYQQAMIEFAETPRSVEEIRLGVRTYFRSGIRQGGVPRRVTTDFRKFLETPEVV